MSCTVFKGGNIIDGSGSRACFVGDVVVQGSVIAAVHEYGVEGRAPLTYPPDAKIIDCAGKEVTPGWIDQHTHYDGQVTWDPYLSPSTQAGVTTCIMGNCGVGFAPCRTDEDSRTFLLNLVEAVEDIPNEAMSVGIDWAWETFPEYLDKLDTLNLAADVAVLITHCPVRAYAIGTRAALSDLPGGPDNDEITKEDIDCMADIVEEAVAAGACGFSTSRIILHRDNSGNLTPGSLAQEAEMLALGRAIAAGGGGVFEGAFDFASYDDVPVLERDPEKQRIHFEREWQWMEATAREYGIFFSFGANPEVFRRMQTFNDKVGERRFNSQVLIRPQGILTNFKSRTNPFRFTDSWLNLTRDGAINWDTPDAEAYTLETLRTPSVREQLVGEALDMMSRGDRRGDILKSLMGPMAQTYHWREDYEPAPEESVSSVAASTGREEIEVAYDFMATSSDGSEAAGCLWRPVFANRPDGTYNPSLESVHSTFMENDHAVPGVADAGAHGTMLTDAVSNTTLLAHYVRDRESHMPIELAVMKSTLAAAQIYGLNDRGVLAPGMKADINVFKLEKLKVLQPQYVSDLPEDAPRWIQNVEGYEYTMCAGVMTYANGQPTGALPGRLVRNPRSQAAQKLWVEQGSKPSFAPYETLLSESWSEYGVLAGATGPADADRGVNAALDAGNNAGASAMARLDRELRKPTGSARNNPGLKQQSRL